MNREAFHDCRAILFDFGGTLDSNGEHWLTRFFALYDGAGFSIPHSQIKDAFYRAVDICYAEPHVASLGLRPLVRYQVHLQFQALGIRERSKEEELVGRFCEKSEAFLRERTLLLNRLRNCFRLGVVSNFYGNLATILGESGLAESLEFIVDSNRVGMRKPDPAIFRLALGRLDLPAQQVIFVGDSYDRDMAPSHQAGMKNIWLKADATLPLPSQDGFVDASITRLSQLEALLS